MATDPIPARDAEELDPQTRESRERTLLADDRTLLAWYRTAFGAYALAVALGGIVPVVSESASSFYRVIGVIFAALGAFAPLIGVWTYIVFQRRAGPGRLPRISMSLVITFGLLVTLLGLATALILALGG